MSNFHLNNSHSKLQSTNPFLLFWVTNPLRVPGGHGRYHCHLRGCGSSPHRRPACSSWRWLRIHTIQVSTHSMIRLRMLKKIAGASFELHKNQRDVSFRSTFDVFSVEKCTFHFSGALCTWGQGFLWVSLGWRQAMPLESWVTPACEAQHNSQGSSSAWSSFLSSPRCLGSTGSLSPSTCTPRNRKGSRSSTKHSSGASTSSTTYKVSDQR